MNKLPLRLCRTILSVVVMVTGIAVLAVQAAPWRDADAPVVISSNADMQSYDRVGLAVDEEDLVVAWAGGTLMQGIYLSQYTSSGWSTMAVQTPDSAWAPDVVVAGGDPIVVWMQGTNHLDNSTKRSIMAQRIDMDQRIDGPRQAVATDVFGEGLPDLVASEVGFHLVYAAEEVKAASRVQSDLYYTYRDTSVGSAWIEPTRVVTYGTVIAENAHGGSVENAQIALDAASVHIVWEQKQLLPISYPPYTQVDHSVWYVVGSLDASPPVWSAPQRLSPTIQRIAIRPALAIGVGGDVHVTWTELVGPRDRPEEQHVFHRTVSDATLTRLNPADRPIRVNGLFPTKAISAMVAKDDLVCVVWHGYYDADDDTLEDITLRCSHDAGDTWAIPIDVSESLAGNSAIFPTLELDDQARVHVAWAEYELAISSFEPYGIFHRSGEVWESFSVFMPLVTRGR